MSDEIKEILDRLERIDHKEYSCGFEFADSGSFDEDGRCFEERKKMANYITNLQRENKQLKDNWDYIKKMLKGIKQEEFNINGYCGICTDIDIDFLLNKMQKLEQRSNSNEQDK